MVDYRAEALKAIRTLVTSGGGSLSVDDLRILQETPDETRETSEGTQRLQEIGDAAMSGFFHCAASGVALVPEERVADRFGCSVEENYPEANKTFLRFARTYWTLRVLNIELMENDVEWNGAYIVGGVEEAIGPVFFPFPSRLRISPIEREQAERQLIEESGADIDIEEFMEGNPILIRERESRSGCLGIGLLLLFPTILGCWGMSQAA